MLKSLGPTKLEKEPVGLSESQGRETPSEGHLIVNGDDFGRSPEVNEAIWLAHRQGILTSASLMVTGDARDHAVQLARTVPSLMVGLHLVLVDGRAVLPPQEIPNVVDQRGFFPRSPIRAGLQYWLNPTTRQQLLRELNAQFAWFAATGLRLAHVDGHLHMHLHPSVFPAVIALAQRYGARRIRVPCDRLIWSLLHDPHRALAKLGAACTFGLLGPWCRRKLRAHGLVFADRTYGLMQSGAMDEAYVLAVLGRLSGSSAELYFHPTTGRRLDRLGANPEELEVLLAPAVRKALHQQMIRLCKNVPHDERLPI